MTVIDINQDHDGDDGGPLPCFWAEGHDHDTDEFVRAVLAYCMDEGVDIPRIDMSEDHPTEVWQTNRKGGDWVEYHRSPERSRDSFPITLLDLWKPSRRGRACGVIDCNKPWVSGRPAIVKVDTDPGHMSVRMWFCGDHSTRFPDPVYRVCMIPVGATILLKSNQEGTRA